MSAVAITANPMIANIVSKPENKSITPYVEKPIHCFNHGVYIEHSYVGLNQPNTCLCDKGYYANCSKYMDTENEKILYNVFNCTDADVDCDGNGKCVKNQCKCSDAYATEKGSTTQCTYKRKQQLAAFLLHIFLVSFGAGHWYIGNVGYAMGQLSLGVIIPIGCSCIVCIFLCIFTCGESEGGLAGTGISAGVISAVCYFGLVIWWIVDIVRFAENWYLDGNGYALQPW